MFHRLLLPAILWLSIGSAQAQTPSAMDWSGFYLGGSLGATQGQSLARTTVRSSGNYFTGNDADLIALAGKDELSQWRPALALQGGYGHQFGSFFLGLEASAGTLFFNDSRYITAGYQTAPGTSFMIEQRVEAKWVANLRPRIGWAQDSWLAYVTGGLAVTHLAYDHVFTDDAFNAFSGANKDALKLGWTAGGGLEYALDRNWSLRGEYLYSDFGSLEGPSELTAGAGANSAILQQSANLRTHSILFGITYRFASP